MKKKIPVPDETVSEPKSDCRMPSGPEILSPDEVFSSYINGDICRHLNPEFFLMMLQYDGAAPLKVCLYTSPLPAKYRLADLETPYHCNDYLELDYVLSGKISVTIGQKTCCFAGHEAYLIRPSVFYQENRPDSHAVILRLCLRPDYFERVMDSALSGDSMNGFLLRHLISEIQACPFLRFTPDTENTRKEQSSLFSDLLREYRTRRPGWQPILQGLFVRLADFLAAGYPFTFSEAEKTEYRSYLFREVSAYMEHNYFDMQMNDLSERFHYQTNFFNRLIHEFTGKTYSEYLIGIRLRAAGKLLEQTDEDIENIMHYIGYNNKGFFYRMFREEYGVTPAVYRRGKRSGVTIHGSAANSNGSPPF